MTIIVTRAGLQTSIQARPRTGQRHLGVPLCGPADPLSMALANRLLGNASATPALEVTLSGTDISFESDSRFAVTGAHCELRLNDKPIEDHRAYDVHAGDKLQVGPAQSAVRSYIAVGGGLRGDEFLDSVSTYMPAAFGGFQGRALRDDDRIEFAESTGNAGERYTPPEFRPAWSTAWALRACTQRNFRDLSDVDKQVLFDTNFTISARADRMGIQLLGKTFDLPTAGYLESDPIFPGCVQCPVDGVPYLLSVDAQTTGGYSQLAQVAKVDRHIIGQLRAGDHLRLLRRTPEQAAEDLQQKHEYWREWLPDIATVI